MDFVPHTPDDDAALLAAIGVGEIGDLFASVPSALRLGRHLDVPPALSEPELVSHLTALASRNDAAGAVCFAGGGAYDHFVPAVVRALVARGEFATSYTPYQPELSQGVLQAIYEFQTMVCELYGMEVANASLYDGGSALVEAVNLAVRATGRERVLIGAAIHPHLRAVLRTWTSGLGLDLVELPFGPDGVVVPEDVDAAGAAAVIVGYPNVFGRLEDVGAVASVAHDAGGLCVAVTDPTAMGLLRSPGACGADVAVGEGQGLGNPLTYGGPYVGFFATRLDLVRQVPGRIAGETLDADDRRAFVLTLQAREQHIRRARATSNVCTNQTLMAIAAAVHLSWLGPEGLIRMGELCMSRTRSLATRLAELPGCRLRFSGATFKEFVLETPIEGERLVGALAERGFLAGPALGRWYPDLSNCTLMAVTERRTEEEMVALAEAVEKVLTEG